MEEKEVVVVLDFGGQYTHLIARRVREQGVYSEILPYDVELSTLMSFNPKGVILSGGPASVYTEDAPRCDKRVLELGIPVLGICYGHQLIAFLMGGEVGRGKKREYGRVTLYVDDENDLFKGFGKREVVWMSHGDQVLRLPPGFKVLAHTDYTPIASYKHEKRPIYGVQFHPEVSHTEKGWLLFRNFLYRVCKCKGSWNMESFVEKAVREIKEKVKPSERVLCAVSGGVDSTTTAVLVHRAVGDRLTCIFVDHGFMRKGEPEAVVNLLRKLGIKVVYVDARNRFMRRLKGVKDPEEKRRIVGEEFIRVFEEEARKLGRFEWLAQGTIYPDRIESARAGTGASRIKSHHNVGALPEEMGFKLLEPLRDLYKDEVREVARLLGLPDEIVKRHPFPGPGLSVRIIGEVTEEKLFICREATAIIEEELKKAGWYDRVWQAFAVVGDDKWVGVLGDERVYGYIVTVRVVESVDGMTASWPKLPYEVLERISRRITGEIPGVVMVTYAITDKPPATIEPV